MNPNLKFGHWFRRFAGVRPAAVIMSVLAILLAPQVARSLSAAEAGVLLWQIGKPDNDDREFALAPKDYQKYREDGFFVVGQSDPQRDWPYVHPGPHDAWAGSRSHTFAIVFGLKNPPPAGAGKLRVDLVDTQSRGAPELKIDINGRSFTRKLPAGAGDASILGQPAQGKEHRFEIAFPADVLKAGVNEIGITTLSGSWMIYDWIGLETPPGVELAPARGTVVSAIRAMPALISQGGQLFQSVRFTVRHYGDPIQARVLLNGVTATNLALRSGAQNVEVSVASVSKETPTSILVETDGRTLASQSLVLKPVRQTTIYILPHSHTDIGYTEIQTAIEKKQVTNLLQGIEYARKTANYPEGARFVWNVEVLWAADLYLRRLSEAQRADFFDAVKKGQVALNGMYLNELTGLCRPEELMRLFRYAPQLGDQCGVAIDSVMISDVPGYTWGTVPAMAQAGIKYFSAAPNYSDRIGDILVQWENKPFYWVSPSGKEKVLVWIPYKGYAMSMIVQQLTPEFVADYQNQLDKTAYPYDLAYMRWAGHGDNAVPDPAICEFVKEWNTKYVWPKFIIASTSEAFSAFEKRYGSQLPQVRGDWTPYWEDGAGSSALETAMNRASSDRLSQAEALFAMFNPAGYPAAAFEDAWNKVLLYSEHTWGADCSISAPESQKTREQWEIKQSYARQADQMSRDLLARALDNHRGEPLPSTSTWDVFNTTSWTRTDLVTLSREQSTAGDRVLDARGRPVPAQRLIGGELCFLAQDVPPYAARRYSISAGSGAAGFKAPAVAEVVDVGGKKGATLDNGLLRVRVDGITGGIVELRAKGIHANLADTSSGEALNDYLYLPGDNLADLKRNGPVTITVREKGPLVASLLIESEAPGCRKLSREVRLLAGFDYVELINTVDKQRLIAKSYHAKEGKESVNFAFPFNVPDGQMWLDLPLGAMRPELDQMPSACKNWFTVGRWADVANRDYGVTWITLDAPLVQVGGITATLLNSQTDPKIWRKHVEPTQKVYSWAMNNHWGTNYRAYQEGPTVFRFILRPHRRSTPADASRLATALSQPLVVTAARGPEEPPRLRVNSKDVLVTALKPSDDGKAWIVRLFGASGKDAKAKLAWAKPEPKQMWLSDTSEKPLRPISGSVPVPAWGIVTVRMATP